MSGSTHHPASRPARESPPPAPAGHGDSEGSEAVHGGGAGAAAGITGDDGDPGAVGGRWPDDIAPDRGSSATKAATSDN